MFPTVAAPAALNRQPHPPVLLADPTAARSALGFKHVHSDLPAIIRTAWAWHQNAHPKRAI
jgi:UDP-glucose 4-epimerase